jgi:hypothetical protein
VAETGIAVRPIADADAPAVSAFLAGHLNAAVPPEAWLTLMHPPWASRGPNHGFALVAGEDVVGAYVAVYSERNELPVCNLAAFCVLEEYRAHSLRLVRALLSQRGFAFTDFSPSGNVVAMNARLGFTTLDVTTWLAPNLPGLLPRGVVVTRLTDERAGALSDEDQVVYRDHRLAPAARHLLVTSADSYAYLMFRRDRRKRVRRFATPLYSGGDRELLRRAWPGVGGHLLARHGLLFTLAEPRVLGFTPPRALALSSPRPRMVKAPEPDVLARDYLYSEFTLVEW